MIVIEVTQESQVMIPQTSMTFKGRFPIHSYYCNANGSLPCLQLFF